MQQQQSPRTLAATSSKSTSPPTTNNTPHNNNILVDNNYLLQDDHHQNVNIMVDEDNKQLSSSSVINNNNNNATNSNNNNTNVQMNRRRGQSTHNSPSNLLIPLLSASVNEHNQQQQQSGVSSPSSSDRRRSVSDGILSSYASNYQPLSNTSSSNSNQQQQHFPSVLQQQHPSSNLNIINNLNVNQQQQPSSSTSPQQNNNNNININNTTNTNGAADATLEDLENKKDEWLVVPILIVSSLPKEVDQILRYYTTGKQLKKQSPPCCVNEKHSHQKQEDPKKEHSDMNIIITDNSLDDMSPMNDSGDGASPNHKKELDNCSEDDEHEHEHEHEHINHKEHGPNHQRAKHHRSSNSSAASSSGKHHHHKSSSGNLTVSFQVPNGSSGESSRRKASTEDSSQGNIQNIQQHIHQQLVLHENQEVKISVAAPPGTTHKQQSTSTSSAKKASSSSNLSKSAEKSPHKLNYYLRKNKRVTEWYIEEVCSLDYLNHVDEFLEKNEVNQISSLANDLLNTGINLEDLISIDEEEFFESVLEKQNHTSANHERRKIMFRVCHTGSRHALSLRQALYKQMILEETTEGNQTIAPTTVIFVYSYTNSNYSLENTAMTWMKEINQIYPDFLSQGNFLLAGHLELNKSTKQQVALLRRGVEDSSANVGLVQKPKHYYHFHQKAVPLFQMKKNQRLAIVEFDTRLGTNIPQLFFESYRLYCLNHYRKKLNQALKPKQIIPPTPLVISGSVSPAHEPSEPQVTSPTLMPSQTTDSKQSEDAKKKKEAQTDPNEPIPPVNDEEEQTLPKTASPSGASLASHKPESKPETKPEKTALPLGILKIFKKSKKEDNLPSSKKPPVDKILKNLKKKKKKEDEIFRWHKIADNLIMSEKPKKKNKKDKQVGIKKDTISATDDSRDVMSDTYFHNRKNMPLFPYSLHLMDQNDTFSPQFERNNSNILSKPIEDDENPYLEDPTENDLMGEASESSSVPDTFEHNFTAVTNTNSSYPGEVIASDNEEADLDTENDIGSEVDDFTFQSSIGSATPQVLNATIFEKQNNSSVLDRNSKDACWEELDHGEDMISVGDIS